MLALNDKQKWNSISDAERRSVAEAVAKRNPTLFFLDIHSFSCGQQSNEIAVFHHASTNMQFHLIPGGDFQIGSKPNERIIEENYKQDLPEFYDGRVNISPFLISQFLVTEEAWDQFDGKQLYENLGPKSPIDAVNRPDVVEWCFRSGTRLPSEAEWEYACKAGTDTVFYWGQFPDSDMAWTTDNTVFGDNYVLLTAAQQKLPNAFGLLGMIGNLGEWVADEAHDYGEPAPQQTPYQPTGKNGVLRGGWNNYDWGFNRSTSRIECSVDSGDSGCSARVAISI